MDRWQDDLIGAVSGDSASEREVFECIQRASRALGFQHVSYGFQAPLPLSRPKFTWLNDYPGDWQTHYIDAGYPAVDPRIIRARQSFFEGRILQGSGLQRGLPYTSGEMARPT